MNKYKVYQTVSYDRYCFVEASNAIEAGIMSQEQDQSWNNDSAIEIFGTQVIKVPLKKYKVRFIEQNVYEYETEAESEDKIELTTLDCQPTGFDLTDIQITEVKE